MSEKIKNKIISNNDLLDKFMFERYKELVIDDLVKIISRCYINKAYCFTIADILLETMVKIGKITKEEAENI